MKLKKSQKEPSLPPRSVDAAVASHEVSVFKFDPRAEIGQDWDFIDRVYQRAREPHFQPDEFQFSRQMAILFPERRDDYRVSEQAWRDKTMEMEHELQNQQYERYLSSAADMVASCPERRAELGLENAHAIMEQLLKVVIEDRLNWPGSVFIIVDFLIAYPELIKKVGLGEKVWKSLRKFAEKQSVDSKPLYANRLASLAILFSGRRHELEFDRSELEEIEATLPALREQNPASYIEQCANLAIISADGIQITNQGLELVHNSTLGQTPELPQRKIA